MEETENGTKFFYKCFFENFLKAKGKLENFYRRNRGLRLCQPGNQTGNLQIHKIILKFKRKEKI